MDTGPSPWDDYWTKLPLRLQGTKGPAIFNVHNSEHDNIIKYMAPYDIPIDQLAADYTNAKAHVIDGKIYYIDLGLMSGAIYYNKDMWAKAGLTDADIPTTWDQFRAVAKRLTVRDGSKLEQAGFNFNVSGSAFQSGLAYQLGQNMFAADGRTPTVDNAANMQVVQRFLQVVVPAGDSTHTSLLVEDDGATTAAASGGLPVHGFHPDPRRTHSIRAGSHPRGWLPRVRSR